MGKIVELELKDLEVPQGLLPRVLTGTVEEKVEEYRELLEEGVEFDPIQVWEREDGRYWVIDGVHRVEAHKRAGKERIKAKLVKCKDELNYRIKAIQANLKHGLALAKGERPILAQMLYRQGLSEEEIKKVFGVSSDTVRKWLAPVKQEEKREKIRRAIELREKGWKVKDIAKELGVDERTVYRYLEEPDKMGHITKMTLLTPAGDPTPEGIRLFEEYLRTQDRLPPAWNWENFSRWLEGEGKEVEGDIKEFVSCFIKPVSRAIKLFAGQGEEDWNAVKRYLSAKEPLSKLTATSREKLFTWAKRFWDKEPKKAEAPSEPPSYSPSAGSQPAFSEEDPYADREAILKKAEEAWERMHAQEELPMEKENKGKRGRPPKEKFFDKDRELEDLKNQMREALWLIVNKFGWEAAAKVLDEVVEEFREDTPAEVWS